VPRRRNRQPNAAPISVTTGTPPITAPETVAMIRLIARRRASPVKCAPATARVMGWRMARLTAGDQAQHGRAGGHRGRDLPEDGDGRAQFLGDGREAGRQRDGAEQSGQRDQTEVDEQYDVRRRDVVSRDEVAGAHLRGGLQAGWGRR
jgi:hypothetical protein